MLDVHYSAAFTVCMSQTENQRIIDAAKRRFSHYGYNKTTMAEIASDCKMSVGNLYRHFKNKEEIAVEGARDCLAAKAEAAETAANAETGNMAALRSFFAVRLRYLHALVSDTPHMYELVELISAKHRNLLCDFETRAKATIESILIDGIRNGEFRDCNTAQRASDLYHAGNRYNMPMCMTAPLDQLERELDSLLDLLYDGLSNRGRQ